MSDERLRVQNELRLAHKLKASFSATVRGARWNLPPRRIYLEPAQKSALRDKVSPRVPLAVLLILTVLGSMLVFSPTRVAGGTPAALTAPTISPQVGSFVPGQTVSVSVTWGAGTGPDYQAWLYAMPTASCLDAYGSSGLLGRSGLTTATAWTESFVATSSDTHLCAVVEDYGTGTMLTSGVTSYSVASPLTSYIANDESAVSIDLGQSVQLTDHPSGGDAPYTYAWHAAAGTSCPASPPASGLLGTSKSYTAPTGAGTAITSTGTYYFQVWVTDSSITPVTTCETVTLTVNAALTGSFTIDGQSGQINGQVGSPPLTAVVLLSGGTGPWYSVTIYSGTDSVCSADTTVVASLDDITGTEAIFSLPEPSAPSSITYYCAAIADGSAGQPAAADVPGPVQLDISPALGTPALSITSTSTGLPISSIDYGQTVSLTATVTWSGGTSPYAVAIFGGSSSSCSSDDQLIASTSGFPAPLSTLTGSSASLTFTSPASSTYYCAVVIDSSVPPSVAASATPQPVVEPLFAVNSPALSASAVELLSPEYEGNTITATVTWSGGTSPYDVWLYTGSSPSCASDTTVVTTTPGSNPQTGVTGTSATFSFLAPNAAPGTFYYCATVTDADGVSVTTPTPPGGTPLVVSAAFNTPAVTLAPTLYPGAPDETDTGQTESATATVTWTGGNAPYEVTLLDGPFNTCALDTAVVSVSSGSNPQPGVYAYTATFVFDSPPATAYYCATITDSSVPVSTGSTVDGAVWTVNQPPTVSLPPSYEIVAGSETQITATSVTIGSGPDYFQWFLGPTCAAADAITPALLGTYSAGPPPTYANTYNTGVLTTDTTYSVVITDSSHGTPAAGNCSSDPVPSISTALSQAIVAVGQSVTGSANLTGVFNAGGTVTYEYFSGSTCSGAPTTVGSAVTVTGGVVPNSAPQAFGAPGYYSWNAVYSGDANNRGATSGCDALTVNASPMTFALSCNHAYVVVGATVTCEATVQGSGSAPTGSVAWSSSGSGTFSSASCTLSRHRSYGACSVKFTPTAAGSSLILIASYGGDSKNFPAAGTYGLTVAMKATKTTVSCAPKSAVAGSSTVITCTAKVTGYSPTGEVTWSQSGTGSVSFASTTCTLSQGTCSVTMTGATAGKVTLQGTYTGDSNNQGSSKKATLTIKKAT
jgi:hypothetical protein